MGRTLEGFRRSDALRTCCAVTAEQLNALIERWGVGGKLKRAVERQEGWRGDDWYRHWPTFSELLEAVLKTRQRQR